MNAGVWVFALGSLVPCALIAQTAAPARGASTAGATPAAGQTGTPAAPPARDDEAPRPRLKFKSRRSNCLCDDPISEESIEAARRAPSTLQNPPTPPRSKE